MCVGASAPGGLDTGWAPQRAACASEQGCESGDLRQILREVGWTGRRRPQDGRQAASQREVTATKERAGAVAPTKRWVGQSRREPGGVAVSARGSGCL